MTVALVFVACLAREPAQCRTVRYAVEMTPVQCVILGQQALVAWRMEHPWLVRRPGYRCETGSGT